MYTDPSRYRTVHSESVKPDWVIGSKLIRFTSNLYTLNIDY